MKTCKTEKYHQKSFVLSCLIFCLMLAFNIQLSGNTDNDEDPYFDDINISFDGSQMPTLPDRDGGFNSHSTSSETHNDDSNDSSPDQRRLNHLFGGDDPVKSAENVNEETALDDTAVKPIVPPSAGEQPGKPGQDIPQRTTDTPASSPGETNTSVPQETALPVKHIAAPSANIEGNENEARANLEALFNKGVSEFTNKKFYECIITFKQVVKSAKTGAEKFPASSNYFNDYIQRANDFISKAERSQQILKEYHQALLEYQNHNYNSCIASVDSFLRHDLRNAGLESYISKANDLRQKAVNAKKNNSTLDLLRNAQVDYRNHNYDSCIAKVDSFLRNDLKNRGLTEYISKADRLRQAAVDNKRKQEQIIANCREAKNNYAAFNFDRALLLYKTALDMQPENVGLEQIVPKIKNRISLLQNAIKLKKNVRVKIKEAVALCKNKNYQSGKSTLLALQGRITQSPYPSYFAEELALINQLLAKIELRLSETGAMQNNPENNQQFSATISNIKLSPSSVEPGKSFTITYSIVVNGLTESERPEATVSATAPGSISGSQSNSFGRLNNGENSGGLFIFHFPQEIEHPGAQQLIINVSCPIKNYSSSASAVYVINAEDESATEQTLENMGASSNDDNQNNESEDSDIKTPTVAVSTGTDQEISEDNTPGGKTNTEQNNKPEVMALIRQVESNRLEIWPGDDLTLTVPVSAFGFVDDKPVNFNITVTFLGNRQTSVIQATKSNPDPNATFHFNVPTDINGGQQPIHVQLTGAEGQHDNYSVNILTHKPAVHIMSTYARPSRIKKDGEVSVTGVITVYDLRPQESIDVTASFSGDISSSGETVSIKNNTTYSFIKSFKFGTGEGTRHYTFNIKSKYGTSSLPGSFIVGRSDEEIKRDRERQEQEQRERNEQQQNQNDNSQGNFTDRLIRSIESSNNNRNTGNRSGEKPQDNGQKDYNYDSNLGGLGRDLHNIFGK